MAIKQSKIYPNSEKEIGWLPIDGVDSSHSHAFRFPDTITAFHWHGETFDLPEDAVHLAKSAACQIQAFQFGKRAMGLQFHLETTPESASLIVDNCRDELVKAPFIQTEETILGADQNLYGPINQLMADILSHLTR